MSGMIITTQLVKQLLQDSGTSKRYYVVDADFDVTDIYIAQAAAANGEECLHQVFQYSGSGSTKFLQKQTWKKDVWSSAYDPV